MKSPSQNPHLHCVTFLISHVWSDVLGVISICGFLRTYYHHQDKDWGVQLRLRHAIMLWMGLNCMLCVPMVILPSSCELKRQAPYAWSWTSDHSSSSCLLDIRGESEMMNQ